MAKLSIVKGATSVLCRIFIQDSTSTTGAGKTGLVFNTSGLTAYRARDDDGNAGGTAMTLATATLGTWTSIGFKEKDATNMPGVYEFGIPNAAIVTGSRSVTFYFQGATGMAPCLMEIELTGVDNQDGVHGGMTALPNAASNAAGGLPVSTAGALDLDEMNTDIEAIQTSTAGLTFTGAGKVDASVRDWVGDTIPARNVTGVPLVDAKYLLGTIFVTPATAGIMDINVKNMNNVAGTAITTIKAVQGLTTADTIAAYTGNTPQTGDAYARLGAPVGASVSVDVAAVKTDTAAVKVQTDKFAFTVANQVDANVLDWKSATAPAMTGDAYARINTLHSIRTNTAQAGSSSTITLDAGANGAIGDFYKGALIFITSGTGAGQAQICTAYNAASKVATVPGWAVAPDNTSVFFIEPFAGIALNYDGGLGANFSGSLIQDVMTAIPLAITLDGSGRVTVITNNDKSGYSLAGGVTLNTGQLSIKKNTALNNFQFVLTDSTTHAPKTGVVVTATRDIDGGGFAGCANAVSEIASGWYTINLANTDLNGTVISLRFTGAGTDDRNLTIITQA